MATLEQVKGQNLLFFSLGKISIGQRKEQTNGLFCPQVTRMKDPMTSLGQHQRAHHELGYINKYVQLQP